ncbi:hypothetical protein phiG2_04 [Lysinibacillus phage phiG2]|nr:hypothetical protein phiG2_04 [Lysinibacillus phage phiG2]
MTTDQQETIRNVEMSFETKINQRGDISFPAIVRKEMGVGKGDRVLVTLSKGILTIKPIEKPNPNQIVLPI